MSEMVFGTLSCVCRGTGVVSRNSQALLTVHPLRCPRRLCVVHTASGPKFWDDSEQETNLGILRGTCLSSLTTERM